VGVQRDVGAASAAQPASAMGPLLSASQAAAIAEWTADAHDTMAKAVRRAACDAVWEGAKRGVVPCDEKTLADTFREAERYDTVAATMRTDTGRTLVTRDPESVVRVTTTNLSRSRNVHAALKGLQDVVRRGGSARSSEAAAATRARTTPPTTRPRSTRRRRSEARRTARSSDRGDPDEGEPPGLARPSGPPRRFPDVAAISAALSLEKQRRRIGRRGPA
jgi:hypothetical protein